MLVEDNKLARWICLRCARSILENIALLCARITLRNPRNSFEQQYYDPPPTEFGRNLGGPSLFLGQLTRRLAHSFCIM